MLKRSISFFLCVIMVLSMIVPVASVFARTEEVYITNDGEEIDSIWIDYDEKAVVEANCHNFVPMEYQWQILIDAGNEIWANIYDKTSGECEISYALVKNIYEESGDAFIRCKVFCNGTWYNSGEIKVLVNFEEEEKEVVYEEPILLSDIEVIENDEEAEDAEAEDAEAEDAEAVEVEDAEEEVEIVLEETVLHSAEKLLADGEAEPQDGENGEGVPEVQAENSEEYVYITINYLDFESYKKGEEKINFSPYVAKILKGSEFKQTVVSPTFLGFSPFYDENGIDENVDNDYIDDSATEIIFDEIAVNEDITLNVFYKPVKVKYAIKYFFQNVNDDLYTEDTSLYVVSEAETGTIISDEILKSYVGDKAIGFNKMYHIPEAVAADGSTVFEVYYDREYYLINFDLDKGYGVDPIYARYGTPFVVNTPVRHGYNFMGWDRMYDTNNDGKAEEGTADGVADTLPSTIPNEKQFYKAIWAVTNTTYTVVYWKENADDNGYSYWGKAEKGANSATKVSGSNTAVADGMEDAEFFDFNAELTDKDVFVEGDGSTVVNIYYTRKKFSIVFNIGNNTFTGMEYHTHTDACKGYVCGKEEHNHESCSLTCTAEEHTHDLNCYEVTCGFNEHVHDAICTCQIKHIHEPNCYTNRNLSTSTTDYATTALNNLKNNVDDPQDGYVYRYRRNSGTYYNFFYLGGTWYYLGTGSDTNNTNNNKYAGIKFSGLSNPTQNGGYTSVSATTPCTDEHHIDSCLECDKTEHIHDDGCYELICTKDEHTHVDSCYGCGKDLHTHSLACTCSTAENKISADGRTYTITAKYEQNISKIWPTADNFSDVQFSYWKVDGISNNLVSKRVTMTADLCDRNDYSKNATFNAGGSTKYLYYMFESFDQTSPANGNQRILRNGIYYDSDPDYYQKVNSSSGSFSQKDITGMIPVNNGVVTSGSNFFLYYTRERFTLTYYSVGNEVKTVEDLMYEQPLAEFDGFVPEYPKKLEPNAYSFGGWYEVPECYDGTEFIFNDENMPNGDLLLYAKWISKYHDVTFYASFEEMNNGGTPHAEVMDVPHGNTLSSSKVENPEKTESGIELVFSGWFYMENGEKKAFSMYDTPIKKSMKIFAEWSSHSPQPYKIEYVLESNPTVKVADDSTGMAYAGSTRTFTAKAGSPYNQLYDEYNKGYFPTLSSHSITIQYEADKEHPVLNTHTFYYVKANNIQYTVKYIDKEKGTEIIPDAVHFTSDSVVTERFVPIENYIPDAFYKRLVIEVEWDEEKKEYVGTENNVIIFYYLPNKQSAYYAIHFMLEKLDSSGGDNYAIDGTGDYEPSGSHIEGIGDVFDDELKNYVKIDPQNFPGFEIIGNKAKTVIGGVEQNLSLNSNSQYEIKVDKSGTELYIFYKRKEYSYTVKYLDYNTKEELAADKTVNGTKYGTEITEEYKLIDGYTCVNGPTRSIVISDKENQNEIVFYYAPTEYVVEYIAVPPEGGELSYTIEVVSGVKDFVGSIPTAGSDYDFDGWYMDEACTIPVDYTTDEKIAEYDETTHKLTPIKSKMKENNSSENESDENPNKFYAKFVPKKGSFIITRKNACDDNQVYVYQVKNEDSGEIITVTVVGNGSVTIEGLLFGNYTVTQINNWSWRNNDAAQAVNHNNVDGTTVIFGETENNTEEEIAALEVKKQWLNGNSDLVKNKREEEN